MNTPQIIIIVLFSMELGLALALHGQKRRSPYYSFWETLLALAIMLGLLIWGGFF
jgi:hypothetical protein